MRAILARGRQRSSCLVQFFCEPFAAPLQLPGGDGPVGWMPQELLRPVSGEEVRGPETVRRQVVTDPAEVLEDPDIDIVIELMGGFEPARTHILKAFENGKHVVTANKAMLAKHGNALAAQAENAGRILAYEAAVAGGIPVVKALREGLAGNRISGIYGILNGTCKKLPSRSVPFSQSLR